MCPLSPSFVKLSRSVFVVVFKPFIIHDMDTFQLAERTLAAYMAHMVKGERLESESELRVEHVTPAGESEELQQREAEARLFHCCQSTSVETVTELTEFAKAMPDFQTLDLNDQVDFPKIMPF